MNRIYRLVSKTLKEMGNVSVSLSAYESLPTVKSKKGRKKKPTTKIDLHGPVL